MLNFPTVLSKYFVIKYALFIDNSNEVTYPKYRLQKLVLYFDHRVNVWQNDINLLRITFLAHEN